MNKQERDLLVLIKDNSTISRSIDEEVEMLHEILYTVETVSNLSKASEIIDLNKYKVINEPDVIARVICQKQLKPFQFINNKN
ncbi:MAG TPA: hypothetical protein VFN30_04325 [Chitinophagaceae bacterium]|nr:hypothetical protein [Chitinophagaceae bacterium]